MEKQQATLTQIERRNSGEDLKASDRLLQTRRSSRNKKRAEFIKHLRNGSEKLNPLVQRFRNKKYEEASRRGALITALQRLKSENKMLSLDFEKAILAVGIVGNIENLNLWSFQLVRKIKGRQNETQVKLVAFYFQSEISFQNKN